MALKAAFRLVGLKLYLRMFELIAFGLMSVSFLLPCH